MLVEKGLNFSNLGYILGSIGFAAAIFEIPSGAIADVFGRILVYRMSKLIYLLSVLGFFLTDSVSGAVVAAFGIGLSVALGSGTYEAWYVEKLKTLGMAEKTQSLARWLQGAMAVGLAFGAVTGGFLPNTLGPIVGFTGANVNLIVVAAVSAVHLALTFVIFDADPVRSHGSEKPTIARTFFAGFREIQVSTELLRLLALGACIGGLLASLEIYWQPRLLEISPATNYSTFGWTTFGFFGMAIAGPVIIGVVGGSLSWSARSQTLVLPFFLPLILGLVALMTSRFGFVGAYLGFMLVYSMINPASFAIINENLSDQNRSTVLSIFSQVFSIGGAVVAYSMPLLVMQFGIADVWLGVAALIVVGLLGAATLGRRERRSFKA